MTTLPRPLDAPVPGPVPSETALSDRAGDVLGIADTGTRSPSNDPLTAAIASLDAVSGVRPEGESVAHGRRREILEAASRLFAVRGYRGTSLRDISGAVGISHPGMLHHFKSKDALLDGVIDQLENHAQHIIDHIDSLEGTVSDLEAIVRRDFMADSHRMQLFAVLSTEAIDPDYPGRMRMIRLRRVYEHIARHVLEAHRERGVGRDDVDLEWAARLFVSITIPLSTRDATLGVVQPSTGGLAGPDFLALIEALAR